MSDYQLIYGFDQSRLNNLTTNELIAQALTNYVRKQPCQIN